MFIKYTNIYLFKTYYYMVLCPQSKPRLLLNFIQFLGQAPAMF